jgi:tetratricopeptide (TPR) repeat protein
MSSLSNPYVVYPVVHAHSLYLNILAELGVVGLGLFLLFLWFVVRGRLNTSLPIKIALFSFLFHNIVEYNFPAPPFQMLFYLLSAVIMQQKDAEPEMLCLSGGGRRLACALVAFCFLVMHLFPAVGFLLLGRADVALQQRDTAKTLRYLLASTYFGYSVPTMHEQTAGFITQVYVASDPKQDDLLRAAEAHYLKALALNTTDGALYLRMADFYVRTGRPAQAEAFLSRAVNIYPYHQIYRIMQSRFYAQQGRYVEAIRMLEESDRFFAKFAPLHRERLDVLWGLATLHGGQKDTERSKEYQARARRLADEIESSSGRGRTGP